MVTTVPVTFETTLNNYTQEGIHAFPEVSTEDALTIKAVYSVREYDDMIIRIRSTGVESLDYYIEGSILRSPDDSSPASDWFTLKDVNGVSLTNITLAGGATDHRELNVINLAYVRVRTENTSMGDIAVVGLDARTNVKRVG
jgi:hypothetical protein